MTTRLTLADPDRNGLSVSTDAVRLSPGARRAVGADVGDPVAVEGGARTVAVVGDDAPQLPDGVVLAGDTVRRNAESTVGASVTVAAVEPVAARSVTVAPTNSVSLSGDSEALSRALAGRPLSVGDRIGVDLFGGSLDVRLTVVDLDPDGPAVVTDETTVSIRPADPTGVDGAVPAVPPDGVGGLDEPRAALQRLVARPLADPEGYAAVGARPPAGVLLAGPSGVGKTRLLGAVAADAGLPIHEVPPNDCGSRESLAAVLRAADDDAPAILLIERLETVAPSSDEGASSAVAWLLDRVRDRDDLVVVGEASSADAVDPALRRGGRFDSEVRVDVPDRAARREVLAVHAADLPLADDADLDWLAARTHGYTGADLEAVVVEAATRAVDRAGDGPATVGRAEFDAAVEAVGPSALRETVVERPSVSYEEIGGLDEAIETVVRTVEWPLRYPELFERLSITPPTGVLLSGPPGTGKTLLAKAVATSTAANFLSVDGPELMNRYVGESERGVRELFDRARRSAPAVVFLDELDALAPARGSTDTGAAERVVSQLLTELDGLSARGEVAVLAATNRPDAIDPALLRPGRIERQVAVPLPDRAARREILAIHLADVPTAGVDLDALAAATAGYTGSDLAGVVREAGLLAMGEALGTDRPTAATDEPVVEHRHLRAAVEASRPSVDDRADDFEWQDP
ncbi:AAA family ATPase [Halohasta salina]|uniref:AAA family ATPase n=1 Tax=Halohasta salina TaxID=2961621 RepID=UPI0020A52FE8|nr:AAA family ATPase [Halohasta salina]